MGIDFNKIFHDMLSAGKGELRQDGKEAQAYFHQVMNDSKDELTMLANDRLEGKLTDAGLQEELRTIKRDTVVDLKRGESVITEEAAERACSAALAVLRESIQKAL